MVNLIWSVYCISNTFHVASAFLLTNFIDTKLKASISLIPTLAPGNCALALRKGEAKLLFRGARGPLNRETPAIVHARFPAIRHFNGHR